MKQLKRFEGLQKGDLVLQVELVADYEKGLNHYKKAEHEMVITRVNKKSYSFKYTKGYMKNSEGKLLRNTDISKMSSKYYLMGE